MVIHREREGVEEKIAAIRVSEIEPLALKNKDLQQKLRALASRMVFTVTKKLEQ